MSKIDLSEVIATDEKSKKKGKTIPSSKIAVLLAVFVITAFVIIYIISSLVNLPFQIESRNQEIVLQDSVNVDKIKIDQVKNSYLLILPNSFWDHTNYVDIDYSNKTIGIAINNILGYEDSKQNWTYSKAETTQTEIISVEGRLTIDNVDYQAIIMFNIYNDNIYFYDLQLKEKTKRAKYFSATPRQKTILIQMMYRDY